MSSRLSKLIRNENMKIYRRSRTWIMIGILLLAVGLLSGIMKWDESRIDHSNWEQQLEQQNLHMKQELTDNPDSGEEYSSYLTKQIKMNDYYLEHDINPQQLSLWSYVSQSSNLIMLVTILTVVIAADMIAAEFSWGTIKLLLVGPASRSKIMISKYIATLGFAVMLLLLCFAASFAAGGILAGFDGLNQPLLTVSNGMVHESSMIIDTLQTYGFSVVSLIMYVTMAFMISSAFRSSSMAIAFSLLFMLLGNTLSALLSQYSWSKYLLFSNIDLTRYLDSGTPLRPEMTMTFSILILVAYYVVFQFIAWLLFTKRDVAA
ncbi:ABC transporter permease [Paenibacillus paeoniae]|uniref:ABC transporter permease n=1 Tax=Paenibacillus paeoniae TaxID=2292705 RepID=A0A371PN51_9BACL|nr:ABC transporter permease [Paenibacillus paeoniae]REK77616.1 ABC transporter permease [Paenibacillus paeoniae]